MKTRPKNSALFCAAWAMVLTGFLAGTAHATNYPLGQQTPTGFSSGTTSTNRIQGMYFTVTGTNVTVTELGCIVPLNTARDAKLWTIGGTQLAQVTVPAGTGWRFASLTSPVALTQGQQYVVTIWGGPDIYFAFGMTTNGWGGDSNIQNIGNMYSYNTTHTFPTTQQPGAVQGIADIMQDVGSEHYCAPGEQIDKDLRDGHPERIVVKWFSHPPDLVPSDVGSAIESCRTETHLTEIQFRCDFCKRH